MFVLLRLGLGGLVLGVIGTQPSVALGLVVHLASPLSLIWRWYFLAHAAYLGDVYAVLHQLGHNLCLRRTSCHLFLNKLGHLFVGHRRLCHDWCHAMPNNIRLTNILFMLYLF
jgi:hypothetical protein